MSAVYKSKKYKVLKFYEQYTSLATFLLSAGFEVNIHMYFTGQNFNTVFVSILDKLYVLYTINNFLKNRIPFTWLCCNLCRKTLSIPRDYNKI